MSWDEPIFHETVGYAMVTPDFPCSMATALDLAAAAEIADAMGTEVHLSDVEWEERVADGVRVFTNARLIDVSFVSTPLHPAWGITSVITPGTGS